jgi:hypothetical protein
VKFANQSVTIAETLDAMNALLRAATLLNSENVLEWHSQGRPSADLPSSGRSSYIWFRLVNISTDSDSGAGRHGMRQTMNLEVNVVTRGFLGSAQRDRALGGTHLAMCYLVRNAIYGRMLHDAYTNATGGNPPVPTPLTPLTDEQRQDRIDGDAGVGPRILTIATMEAADLPAMDRPRPEQGQVETRIGVAVKVVLRVTTDDIAALES